jgi:hypothetical protein
LSKINELDSLDIFKLLFNLETIKRDENVLYTYLLAIAILLFKKDKKFFGEKEEMYNKHLNSLIEDCDTSNAILINSKLKKTKHNILPDEILNAIEEDDYMLLFSVIKQADKLKYLENSIQLLLSLQKEKI